MKERAIFTAPIFVALVLHAWSSGAWAQDAFIATFALVAIPVGGRLPLGVTGRRALGAFFFAVGAALAWSHAPDMGYGPGTLPRSASLVAAGSLLAASSRLYVRAGWWGERATFVLGMLAAAASGATRLGPGYILFAAFYLGTALVALRMRDGARPRPADLGRRDRVALVAVLVIASGFSGAFMAAAPRAHDAIQRAFDRAYQPRGAVGFGSGASLGSMREMIRSDEEVLRLAPPPHAAPIDYLRGAVYDEYSPDGSWAATLATERIRSIDLGPSDPSAPTVHVRRVAGDATRYFLPLRARGLSVRGGRISLDGGGVAHTVADTRALEHSFVVGDRDELAPTPPAAADLQIPPSERAALAQLAREWTASATSPEAVLEAIRRRFGQEFTYSLSFLRNVDDPLLDFLFRQKLGYCTYFASGMVMLARASGIPARLVAGYRVGEWSPVAGEWIVREKNAHAWVEAWVGGAWRTFDPTPTSDLPQDEPHVTSLGTMAADAVARAEAAVAYTVSHVTPAQLFFALVVLVALWAGVRAYRARARRTVRARADAANPRALPCFDRLAVALAKQGGHARAASESLGHFAARLHEAGLAEAAALIERYAAYRYGGLGDEAHLETDVDRFLARR